MLRNRRDEIRDRRAVLMAMDSRHVFTKSQIENLLNDCINRTVGEIDTKGVLSSGRYNKGYVGAVIEQSVLGYPADCDRRPDLLVDGSEVELKTTGIVKSRQQGVAYEAKEPMSITAVRPEEIVNEEFENSAFWEKTRRLLIVYYLYAHQVSSPAEYGDFPIKDYEFIDFYGENKKLLEHDWTIVRDFIREIQEEYPDDSESQYPRISSELNRQKLTVIDTAPKWPNRPRFRLKRAFVSNLVNNCFGEKYDKLPHLYSNFDEIMRECARLTNEYGGMTIDELFDKFGVNHKDKVSKRDSEAVAVRMFGGTARCMNKVEIFSKLSIVGRTIVLSSSGKRTEDMKLFPIDFEELQNPEIDFEMSEFRANFADSKLLCIIFQEPGKERPFGQNIFRGFKLVTFSDAFIEQHVRPVWNRMRELIFTRELRLIPKLNSDGSLKRNKNGQISEAPNWPKSRDGIIFVRGTGTDSNPRYKREKVNGLAMYPQQLWVKGSYMVDLLGRRGSSIVA